MASRRLARFRRSASFTWNGRVRGRRLPDGFYYARYTGLATNGKPEVRTYAFRLLRGRMFRLAGFTRPDNCGPATSPLNTSRPGAVERCSIDCQGSRFTARVAAGRRNRTVYAHVRLSRAGRATLELFRGSRRVRRIGTFSLRSQRTRAIRINPAGLGGGSYRVKVSVVAGRARTSKGLSARRL